MARVNDELRGVGMQISYCTEAEAFYVTIGWGEIAGPDHIPDDVIVDTEADATVHGLELLCPPAALTNEERQAVLGRFPKAAEALAAIDRQSASLPETAPERSAGGSGRRVPN